MKDGEYVYLENQEGIQSSSKIKVKLTQRIRPEVVYMVHGFGHTHPGLKAGYKKGASDAEMISQTVFDPVMGPVGSHNNFVKLVREV